MKVGQKGTFIVMESAEDNPIKYKVIKILADNYDKAIQILKDNKLMEEY